MYRNTPASMQFVEQNSPIKSIVYFKSSFLRSKGSSSCSIRFGSLFLFLNTKRCNAKPNTSLLNLPYPEWSVAECCMSLSERTAAAQSLSFLTPPHSSQTVSKHQVSCALFVACSYRFAFAPLTRTGRIHSNGVSRMLAVVVVVVVL